MQGEIMNVWIITTGSSDVQLTTDKHWNSLCDKARNQLNIQKKIELTKSVVKPKGSDSPITRFLAHARAMGIVYGNALTEKAEYYNDLDFPLLNNFCKLLNEHNITLDRIIVLVTDQSNLFNSSERNNLYCPYWQDTSTLSFIIEKYLEEELSIKAEFSRLQTNTEKPGLDDWNYVLDLIKEEFRKLADIPQDATVYISHQAGTPAISSAVQFVSLARFEERVRFLVSNEHDPSLTGFVDFDSSSYLRELQLEKANKLLDRHDYSGVKELLDSSLKPEVKILLDAAIQWNFAKFDEFINQLESYPKFADDVQKRKQLANWWWMAYESAYLAVVRLKQGNTVEAMFHSFRAVEGLLAKWLDEYDNFEKQGKKVTKQGKKIKLSHKIVAPWDNTRTTDIVNAFGQGLYYALEFFKGVDKSKDTEIDIWTFGNYVFHIRNSLFHNLEGLKDKEEVFKAWEISSDDEQERKNKIEQKQKNDEMEQKWKDRVLGCLNFIAEPEPRPTLLEEASLMSQVHKKLKDAIAQYEHTP